MSDPVASFLETYVPRFDTEAPDWRDVVARSAVSHPRPRRRALVAAAAFALLVAVLATPALGVQGLVLHLLGRKNVSFANSKSAPNEVKKQFEDLAVGAPAAWAPHVIAAQARVVATFSIAGHPRRLWVAPTRGGGYCFTFEENFGGCRKSTAERTRAFGVTWESAASAASVATRVGGDITAPSAAKIVAHYADGTNHDVPFVWVSRPIAAGFFSYDIPVAHWTTAHRLATLDLLAASGKLLGRQTFPVRMRPPALRIRTPIGTPKARVLPTTPPVAPTAPLQHGSGGGFAVAAGGNGAVQFTELHTTPILTRLAGLSAGYSCFRLTREFGIFTARGVGDGGRFAASVGLQERGVGGPFDGCEVQASFGRRWPDALGNHAAAEIPLTPAGRRFFADRAAARDLALFVRSRRMHTLRREPAAQAKGDIEQAYGRQLARSPIRITVVDAATLRFDETSPTGRRFHVTVRDGRIREQNLKPYGFVF